MKKIIKLIVIVIAVTTTIDVLFAQNFGVKAGVNLLNIMAIDDNRNYNSYFKPLTIYHIGAIVDFPLTEMFSIETALILSTKGFIYSDDLEPLDQKVIIRYNLSYIDIPLTAKASFDVNGIKIYGLLGPYLGFGLSGKARTEVNINNETISYEEDIKWGDERNQSSLKRLDYGLVIGGGTEINAVQFGLTYGYGLANILTSNDDNLIFS